MGIAILFANTFHAFWAFTCPPVTCPLSQYCCPKVIKGCHHADVMPWCHMMSGIMTKWLCAIYICHTIRDDIKRSQCYFNLNMSHHKKKSENHALRNGSLDLWPWPSNLSEMLSKAMFLPYCRSVAQMVQPCEHWQTDRHTHTYGTDFIPSTTDVGGNKFQIQPT